MLTNDHRCEKNLVVMSMVSDEMVVNSGAEGNDDAEHILGYPLPNLPRRQDKCLVSENEEFPRISFRFLCNDQQYRVIFET